MTGKRQYIKNVGRTLKVLLVSGQEVKGKLKEADDVNITMLVSKKEKGKKAQEEEVSLSYEDIKKSVVQVSFK